MSRTKVVLDVPFPSFIGELFTPHCELLPWATLDADPATRESVEAIVSFTHFLIGDDQMRRLPNVRVVSNYGVGVDHIDVEAVRQRGAVCGHTPGVVDGATADLAFGLMLALARNVVPGDAYARGPEFVEFDPANLLGRDVFGATLGIIGMGRIGQAMAKRANGFDMNILYHNRRRDEGAEQACGAEYVDLDTLLTRSDFVSIHTPLTPSTRGLLGQRELKLMRPDAYVINTARGAVIDMDALYDALEGGWIAGAGIDVTEPEPLPRDHKLLQCQNLVITPHLGTSSYQTRRRMGEMTRDNLLAGLEGTPLPWPVQT